MILEETRLARQLLSDEAPPVSGVFKTVTSLLLYWRGRDDRLDVELTLDLRAHWRYRNYKTQELWTLDQDIEDGWPAEGKRQLMRFNRRAA